MRRSAWLLTCGLALVACALAGCRAYRPPRPDPTSATRINSLPPARLRNATVPPTPPTANESDAWLVERKCGTCHSPERLMSVRLDWRGWRGEVGHMVQNGAVLTVPEQQRIVDYLGYRGTAMGSCGWSDPYPGWTTSPTVRVPTSP